MPRAAQRTRVSRTGSGAQTVVFGRVAGESLDLRAGGILAPDPDPVGPAAGRRGRHEAPWTARTREAAFAVTGQCRIGARIGGLNELVPAGVRDVPAPVPPA